MLPWFRGVGLLVRKRIGGSIVRGNIGGSWWKGIMVIVGMGMGIVGIVGIVK